MTVGGITDWRHYIRAGSELVAVMSRQSSGTNVTHYVLSDHQGSIARITDGSGVTTVGESFSAYGTRRDPTIWSGLPSCSDLCIIKSISREGYTGQDAIGGVSMGLNHMNGRVQDAVTGRFLSADPYVSQPGNTQSFSRYSYVNNNPLSYTDPTGFAEDPVQYPELEEIVVEAQVGGYAADRAYVGSNPGGSGGNNENFDDIHGRGNNSHSPSVNVAAQGQAPQLAEIVVTAGRLPDYVTFQLDLYVFSVSATYTVYGDIFFGKGATRSYPSPRFKSVGVSISDGWMLTPDNAAPTQSSLNNFLIDWSGSTGGYVGVGGSYQFNAAGSSINLGVGFGGFAVSPGNVNSYQGNIFGNP